MGYDLQSLLQLPLFLGMGRSELADIDFYGLLESGGVSLVEWGDKFEHALPEDRLDITIKGNGNVIYEKR